MTLYLEEIDMGIDLEDKKFLFNVHWNQLLIKTKKYISFGENT